MSLIAIVASGAAMAEDSRDCLGHNNNDVRIQSCSALILRDPHNAVAFYNRGLAHAAKDEFELAIADYASAIELNPNYGQAFEALGRVHARKGD